MSETLEIHGLQLKVGKMMRKLEKMDPKKLKGDESGEGTGREARPSVQTFHTLVLDVLF